MASDARVFNSLVQARRALEALRIASEFPRRDRRVGVGPWDQPREYSLGAPGWTAAVVRLEKHPELPRWAIKDHPAVSAFAGRPLDDGSGGTVTLGPVVARGPDWDVPPGLEERELRGR